MNRILLPGLALGFFFVACSQQAETVPLVEEVRTAQPADAPRPAPASAEPVMVGGEPRYDACGTVGMVSGLDPKGDNFLAVRVGPGTQFLETDRLPANQQITICDDKGDWLGVVYAAGKGEECGVATPQKRRAEYAGPCKSGWVAEKYVTQVAG